MSNENKATEEAFSFDDIEDVKLIIKAKGKHYSIIPKGDKEDAKLMRIAMLGAVLGDYYIVDTPLEDIKQKHVPETVPCPNCQGCGCTTCGGYGTLTY